MNDIVPKAISKMILKMIEGPVAWPPLVIDPIQGTPLLPVVLLGTAVYGVYKQLTVED